MLWMMKIRQVKAEIWMALAPCWSFSQNWEMAKFDCYTPYLHDVLATIHSVDSKRHNSCGLSHIGSDHGHWRLLDASMAASLLTLHLAKGKSKFHPTTTKLLLSTCLINRCGGIMKKVVVMWMFVF